MCVSSASVLFRDLRDIISNLLQLDVGEEKVLLLDRSTCLTSTLTTIVFALPID